MSLVIARAFIHHRASCRTGKKDFARLTNTVVGSTKYNVIWCETVEKDLDRIPSFIAEKFRAWVHAVERDGLVSVRQLKGFRDKPLRGNRTGQRSVRLNRAYRVIYIERWDRSVSVVCVIQVDKHGY